MSQKTAPKSSAVKSKTKPRKSAEPKTSEKSKAIPSITSKSIPMNTAKAQKKDSGVLLPLLILLIPISGFLGYCLADHKAQTEIYEMKKTYMQQKSASNNSQLVNDDIIVEEVDVQPAPVTYLTESIDPALVGTYSQTSNSNVFSLTINEDGLCSISHGRLASPVVREGFCTTSIDLLMVYIDGSDPLTFQIGEDNLIGLTYDTEMYGDNLNLSR